MRNSFKLILGALMFMLAALRPDFAAFIPLWVKAGAAGVLLLLGLYQLWKEREWRG